MNAKAYRQAEGTADHLLGSEITNRSFDEAVEEGLQRLSASE